MMAKYKTEKRKANVGERILITNATISCGNYKNGDVLTVGGYYQDPSRHAVKSTVPGMISINHEEYEVIVEAKPSKNERITLLESQVAELQAEVQALKFSKQAVDAGATIRETLAKLAKEYTDSIPKMLTPNEQRKAVIERAKAFVAEGCDRWFAVEFHVNSAKRTVVALLRSKRREVVITKAIAKCAPDDVFNADIGKAIALGRALGLDVSEFENAVKPTEYAIGQRIRYSDNFPNMRIVEGKTSIDDDEVRFAFLDEHKGKPILDDTEAQY